MERSFPKSLQKRWDDPKGLIQVLIGPRQVGKTTAAVSLMNKEATVYVNADLPTPPTADLIVDHWKKGRLISSPQRTLVLDEVQKIPRWSETVKGLWDEDRLNSISMRVCLLGSSAILMEKGLSESLTGRFELNFFPHWTFPECHRAFGASLEEYEKVGGYPKAYDFKGDPERREEYLRNSILEPTLGRDVLVLHSVDKPALLRQLFWYVSRLPANIVSYEKILGHLQGSGNSATLVRYAELLAMAFLVCPLTKFSVKSHRTKRSIPKWLFPSPSLVDSSVRKEGLKGFVFENLVGSHLLNIIFGQPRFELKYWREDSREIDFILTENNEPVMAIEVKSGRAKNIPSHSFLRQKGINCPLKIITLENATDYFMTTSVEEMLKVE